MSVLVEFAMFPTDKGESVSSYVSRIIKMFKESDINYKLTPMGTIFETETMKEALAFIDGAYKCLESDCSRIYSSVKLDVRKNQSDRMQRKVLSIQEKIGNVNI